MTEDDVKDHRECGWLGCGDSQCEPVCAGVARRWAAETGVGRMDVEGVEWFACDPYPTWYRWENGKLRTKRGSVRWAS